MGEDQRLKPCPDTPNCVCSEDYAHPRYVPPLGFEGPPEVAWLQARQAATELGGHIEKEEFGYLWATYRTPVLRFVDDLELRLDVNSNTIHVRSASRVGYSDLGANRKRVEKLRERFEALRKP